MNYRFFLCGAALAGSLLAGACARHAAAPSAPTPSPIPTLADPLNGAGVPRGTISHRVTAVMIDNYPDARPQSGLHDADLVYEVEAEGGITRYLALFLANPVAVIGPVRSARTYFVDLARPYDPYFAHAGENDDTIDMLKELRASGFADLDQITQISDPFWRDDTREMPHNLYTSIARIRTYAPKFGYADVTYAGHQFAFDAVAADAAGGFVPEAVVSFWNDYDVHFVWDGAAYQRFIDGQAQYDREDDRPYEVSDIVAVWIPAKVLDQIGDLAMNVYNTFPALLIRRGQVTSAQWIASGPTALPNLVADDGSALQLTPGQIYIEVLPQGSSVKNGKQSFTH